MLFENLTRSYSNLCFLVAVVVHFCLIYLLESDILFSREFVVVDIVPPLPLSECVHHCIVQACSELQLRVYIYGF